MDPNAGQSGGRQGEEQKQDLISLCSKSEVQNAKMQIQKAVNKKPKPKGTKTEGAGGVESKTKLQKKRKKNKLNKVKTKEV